MLMFPTKACASDQVVSACWDPDSVHEYFVRLHARNRRQFDDHNQRAVNFEISRRRPSDAVVTLFLHEVDDVAPFLATAYRDKTLNKGTEPRVADIDCNHSNAKRCEVAKENLKGDFDARLYLRQSHLKPFAEIVFDLGR